MNGRKYGLDCPVAQTLDVIGERWTILVLRDLFLYGPRRFQDFENSLAGLTPSVLSSRLKELEERGIIERRLYADHPPRAEYLLTPKGRELGPVLKALRAWGEKHGGSRQTAMQGKRETRQLVVRGGHR